MIEVSWIYPRYMETGYPIAPRGVGLGRVSEIFGDVRERIRKLRPRNTIAIPIVSLLFIGAGILTAGYYINKSVFHAVFEERESNKARTST
jgi:hypothetical protein